VRRPASTCFQGLTHGDAASGDIDLFERQHRAYVDALSAAGLDVEVLEPLDAFPDAHFVEDVAVIVPELIVVTRPGATERRGEPQYMEPSLQSLGELEHIVAPGTLDGGDVLMMGRRCFIGRSQRSNAEGVRQLSALLESRGYACSTIEVEAGLHLKSSLTAITDDTVAVCKDISGHAALSSLRKLVVDSSESYAANLLRVNERLLVPADCIRTIDQLAALCPDVEIVPLDVSEARRMDGGLTCMSLRF
jgi:dimethylargininase